MKTSQWMRVKNAHGQTIAFVEVFWSEATQAWIEVPGVSKRREIKALEREAGR